jgi:lipopolysaccharide export system protein LptC
MDGAPAGYGRGDEADIARKFRTAARHSRRVRVLRVTLPIAIVLAAAGVVAVSYFNPLRMLSLPRLDLGKVVVSGTKVTMAAPRLAGFTRDARAYDLTARAASQDVTKPDILELEGIRAKIAMQDKSNVDLTADSGIYDRKIDELTLIDNILLTSSAGYEARLKRALVEVKSGRITSQQPVDVKFLNGTLNANKLEVDDKGEVIRFEGGVSMLLNPDATRNGSQAPQ